MKRLNADAARSASLPLTRTCSLLPRTAPSSMSSMTLAAVAVRDPFARVTSASN